MLGSHAYVMGFTGTVKLQVDPVRFISTIFLTPEHLDTVGRLFKEHVNYLCIKQKQDPCQFSMWFLKCKLKGWKWASEASWWMQRYLKETSLWSNPTTVILATSSCGPDRCIGPGKAVLDLSPSIPQLFGFFTSWCHSLLKSSEKYRPMGILVKNFSTLQLFFITTQVFLPWTSLFIHL